MTVDVRPRSTSDAIEQLSQRLYKVEQRSSSPSTASPGIGTDPSVDTITIGGIVVGSAASPARTLTLSTGAFMEDIWIDADWLAPLDDTASNYDVELARKVGSSYELVNLFHTGVGTSLRMASLEPAQAYGVRVTAINRIGVRADPEPPLGFQDITTGIDATIPGQVTGVVVSAGFRTVTIIWNAASERDVARGAGIYQVDLSSDSGFASVSTESTSGTIMSFTDLSTNTIYYARVKAIDSSGNAGAFSSTASATTGFVGTIDLSNAAVTTSKLANAAVDNSKLADLAVDAAKLADSAVTSTKIANLAVGTAAIAALAVGSAQIADAAIVTAKIGDLAVNSAKIAALAVTNAKIADLAVDNAKIADLNATKITAGTLDANRIAANSIDVDKLTASTLTSKTITLGSGGTLKIGTAPTTGILINDQGIRLYSGGVVKVALDVAGTASFEGNISASTITSSTLTSATINSGTITGTTVRTAASGQRLALEASSVDALQMYSGHSSESRAGRLAVAVAGTVLTCQLDSPTSSGNDYTTLLLQSTLGGNGTNAYLSIWNSSGTNRALFGLTCASNGSTPHIFGQGISDLTLSFTAGSTGVAKLVGSGDYGFLYLQGGGIATTLNVNVGLGAGFHVLSSTNATFQPIQASAFNVSSARSVKRNVRKEKSSALDRLNALQVVRFQRVHDEDLSSKPEHLLRELLMDEIGFIADDVIEVVPEAVLTDAEGKARSVNLSVMISVLVKAIQELSQRR